MPVINSIISMFSTKRLAQIDFFKENPIQVQRDTLVELLRRASDTEYGLKYDFDSILTAEQYRERLPIIHYEELAPYSERLMNGEQNLLWPEPITWFAKSSGTTNDKSKFIPVSNEALHHIHYQGGKVSLSRSAKNLWKAAISEAVRMLSPFSINYTRMHKYSTGRPWL